MECLGFGLYGDDEIKRAELLDKLLDGQEERKKDAIKKIWSSLADFLHLGRHEKGAPVELTRHDGEIAVVLTTELLNYIAQDGR